MSDAVGRMGGPRHCFGFFGAFYPGEACSPEANQGCMELKKFQDGLSSKHHDSAISIPRRVLRWFEV